ncbi:hypothetical protein NE865_12172 [Phthorimaea operculella]|nr:hypothetical protein NE865_12172 [Phthorimaea operculella]
MSVSTVKCVNCNVVINEILAFIRNRHDVMDNESLIRICTSAFSEEEVDQAKKLMFTSTKTSQKCISRRKDKKQKDLEDIISVFKTIDPEQIPVFVAYDLHKLPPVSFDHVDVTKLLKDIVLLRAEIQDIKRQYVTKDQLETATSELKIPTHPFSTYHPNVNTKRGGFVLESGPFGLSNAYESPPAVAAADAVGSSRSDMTNRSAVSDEPAYRSILCANAQNDSSKRTDSLPPQPVNSTLLCNIDNTLESENQSKQSMMSDLLKGKGCDWKDNNKYSDEWIEVQKRKTKNRFEGRRKSIIKSDR